MPAIAFTANPLPGVGAVRLSFTAAPNSGVVITRTDPNGIGTVRLLAGQVPASGVMVVDDFEATLQGALSYTAQAATTGTGYTATTVVVDLSQVSYGTNWLGVPVFPALNQAVARVVGFTQKRQSKNVYFDIIGRDSQVANIQPSGLRTGTLTFRCHSTTEKDQLENALLQQQVLYLRMLGSMGQDIYFLVDDFSIDIIDEQFLDGPRYLVSVTYREVGVPTGPRQGTLGWTVAQVAAKYTVAGAASYYRTVANMATNTRGY